jgi:UPF0755 protein
VRRLIALLLVLAVLGVGASRAYDWWNYNLNTPVSSTKQAVVIHVQPGEVPAQVGDDLQSKNLIRSKDVFEWYVRLTGIGSRIQAGAFVLSPTMSLVQIANALENGKTDQIAVLIPEGFPLKFQAAYVDKAWPGMGAPYLAAAGDPSWSKKYDFLAARPANANPPLEGYLFPDTYLIDPNAGVNGLIAQQLDQFGNVMTSDIRAQTGQATPTGAAATPESRVILAPMVQPEPDRDPDRGNVCSVYYNRLARGIPLGVDATLLYGLGRLTPEPTYPELQMNTPWNTRKHAGLPPGPISNPGKAALLACVNPPKTAYLFYFTDRTGTTHFETNQQDFDKDIQKYGVSGS